MDIDWLATLLNVLRTFLKGIGWSKWISLLVFCLEAFMRRIFLRSEHFFNKIPSRSRKFQVPRALITWIDWLRPPPSLQKKKESGEKAVERTFKRQIIRNLRAVNNYVSEWNEDQKYVLGNRLGRKEAFHGDFRSEFWLVSCFFVLKSALFIHSFISIPIPNIWGSQPANRLITLSWFHVLIFHWHQTRPN